MADLLVAIVVVGFFAGCVAYVRGCDRLLGSQSTVGSERVEATR